MQFGFCGCPCQNCQSGTGSICNLLSNESYLPEFNDTIFLGGEQDGIFKLIIRRLNYHIDIAQNQANPFVWFTICIPMTGNIGSYHFESDETPTDCWGYIKKYICNSQTKYYFWLGKKSGMTEPPLDNVDKSDYLYIYNFPERTTIGGPITSLIPKYYLLRTRGLFENLVDNTEGFIIPSTMNINIPYVFWASPKTCSVNINFTSGKWRVGWCNLSNQVFDSVEIDYSQFNGTYILTRGTFVGPNQGYFDGMVYESDEITVGQIYQCGGFFTQYYTVDIQCVFYLAISGFFNGVGVFGQLGDVTVGIVNTTDILNLGVYYTYHRYNFPIDFSGPSQQNIPCIDKKLLNGKYDTLVHTESQNQSNCGTGCPPNPIDTSGGGRCGIKCSFDDTIPEVTIEVIEWGGKYGCI